MSFVTLPASKNALKKLGERLAAAESLNAEDAELLNAFILAYDEPLAEVQSKVAAAGYESTSRLKTRGTLIDKLRRDPHTKLPSVQDVAGLRITVDGLAEQDEAVDRLRSALAETGGTPKVIDRRTTPTHGYRAVHIIATSQGVPVEIQVRTLLQDLWAQVSERMGDVYGRDIRYGGDPSSTGDESMDAAIRQLVDQHRFTLSDYVREVEVGVTEGAAARKARSADEEALDIRRQKIEDMRFRGLESDAIDLEMERLREVHFANLARTESASIGWEKVGRKLNDLLLAQIARLGRLREERTL